MRVPSVVLFFCVIASAACAHPPRDHATHDVESSTSNTSNGLTAASAQAPMTLRELGAIVGANCDDPDTGSGCSGGDYDIELHPDCGQGGMFAGVSHPSGALLVDKAPPEDTVRRAVLAQGQLVCIQAIAFAGDSPSYYYVVALSPSASAACKGRSVCRKYGDRNINWKVPNAGRTCHLVANGRVEGNCAAGWVRESRLEVFSN